MYVQPRTKNGNLGVTLHFQKRTKQILIFKCKCIEGKEIKV